MAIEADARSSAETRVAVEPLLDHHSTAQTRIGAAAEIGAGASSGRDATVTVNVFGDLDVSAEMGEPGAVNDVSVATPRVELAVEGSMRPLSAEATPPVEAPVMATARQGVGIAAEVIVEAALVEQTKDAVPALTGQVCTAGSSTTTAATTGTFTAGLDTQGELDACATVDGEEPKEELPVATAGGTVEATASGGLGLGW